MGSFETIETDFEPNQFVEACKEGLHATLCQMPLIMEMKIVWCFWVDQRHRLYSLCWWADLLLYLISESQGSSKSALSITLLIFDNSDTAWVKKI